MINHEERTWITDDLTGEELKTYGYIVLSVNSNNLEHLEKSMIKKITHYFLRRELRDYHFKNRKNMEEFIRKNFKTEFNAKIVFW